MSSYEYKYETNNIKSYANKNTLVKAVGKMEERVSGGLRYIVYTRECDGRLVPVFIGEKAIGAGVHFHHPVIG